jgi:non-canonical (house-cleaning) NTP pyrophosphatase
MDIDQAIYHYKISPHQRLGRVAGGMIGLLTKNRITRKEYTKQSIITALIQLENKKLYS